jgi:hypothetical protein
MKKDFTVLLLGKDLRSIARTNEVVRAVVNQESFDELFNLLLHHERLLVMRAADGIEKVTIHHPEFLAPHKKQLLSLLHSSIHKELKWHMALLVSRVSLTDDELKEVWGILSYWVRNPNESKIVRVNSLQGMYEMTEKYTALKPLFDEIVRDVEHEPIPSLQARIKKLRKAQRRE